MELKRTAFIVTWLTLSVSALGVEWTTVHPQDTGQALINPDMGWTLHFYSNIPTNYGSKLAPSDTVDDFPGLSVVYLRVPWAFLEPEEGQFNWALLDTPAQRWISRGKKVAFRLTCSENWTPYATPEWVRLAGAKGTFYRFGHGPDPNAATWDPDFGDPVFLAKLEAFLAAMAVRYDGNPDVAFMDIGTYGMWGEGHTHMSSQVPEEKELAIVKQHIDLHVRLFPRTLLCISDDVVGHDKPGVHFPETDYALAKGVTLRDDSIMVQPPPRSWYHSDLAQLYWPTLPVILEHEHFGSSKARGAWGDGSLLLKAVEDYRASYMSIHWWPREELNENRDLVDRINQRLGYRLQLRQMDWPSETTVGESFTVKSQWANVGVAPCYPGGFLAVTLKDERGGIAAVLVDDAFNMRQLKVGLPGEAPTRSLESRFRVGLIAPTTRPGTYQVYVSVGARCGTPLIALPLADADGQRRYRLGTVSCLQKD